MTHLLLLRNPNEKMDSRKAEGEEDGENNELDMDADELQDDGLYGNYGDMVSAELDDVFEGVQQEEDKIVNPAESDKKKTNNKNKKMSLDANPDIDIPARYVISELHRADPKLFDTGNIGKRYSRICGHVNLRQPIRVSPAEYQRIQELFPDSLSGYVSSGSTPKASAANMYVCPKVWCPKSRVAMTLKQYDEANKTCPLKEDALIFDDPTYWNGRERHPGFLDPKFHPSGLCMPCCFLKPGRKTSRCQKNAAITELPSSGIGAVPTPPDGDGIINNSAAANNAIATNNKYNNTGAQSPLVPTTPTTSGSLANTRYIYSDNTRLPNNRYGFLPMALHKLFNSGSSCAAVANAHLTNRTSCVLRKGVRSGSRSFWGCLQVILGPHVTPQLIKANLDPATFIMMHRGELARSYMPPDLTDALLNTVSVESFCEWFTRLSGSYVERFNLQGALGVIASGVFARRAAQGAILQSATPDDMSMLQATREYALYLSMNKYISDVQRAASHHLLIELVNFAPEWLNPSKIFLLVFVRDSSRDDEAGYTIACPYRSSVPDPLRPQASFIIQDSGQYEIITTVTGMRGSFEDIMHFDTQRMSGVRHLIDVSLAKGCREDIDGQQNTRAASVVRALQLIGDPVSVQVIDYELRCVGLLTHATGIYVPLPMSEGLITTRPSLSIIYLEDLNLYLIKRVDAKEVEDAMSLFRRLAAMMADTRFDPVRVVQHKEFQDNKSILLRMGKLSPLTISENLFRTYQKELNAFVNIPFEDSRVSGFKQLHEDRVRISETRSAFLREVQLNLDAFVNLTETLLVTCQLPWDVRHAYIAFLVRDISAVKDANLSNAVADSLLLGMHQGPGTALESRRRTRETAETGGSFIIDYKQLLDSAAVDDTDWSPQHLLQNMTSCSRMPVEMAHVPVLPPVIPENIISPSSLVALQTMLADLTSKIASKDANKKVDPVLAIASLLGKAVLKQSSISSSRGTGPRMEIMVLPLLSVEMSVDILLHVNDILHSDAPMNKTPLYDIVKGQTPANAFDAITRALDIPLGILLPDKNTVTPKHGFVIPDNNHTKCVLLVELLGRRDEDVPSVWGVVLSRMRPTRAGVHTHEQFGIVHKLSLFMDGNMKLRVYRK